MLSEKITVSPMLHFLGSKLLIFITQKEYQCLKSLELIFHPSHGEREGKWKASLAAVATTGETGPV